MYCKKMKVNKRNKIPTDLQDPTMALGARNLHQNDSLFCQTLEL